MKLKLYKLVNAVWLLTLALFICPASAQIPSPNVVAGNTWTTPGTPPPITPGTAQIVNCPDATLPTWPGQYVTNSDPASTAFYIYIPNNFDPNKTYGVISMIWGSDNGTMQSEWRPICDTRNLIFIAPQNAGNSVYLSYRASLLLTGVNLIKKYYKIDPNRVYLSGNSGGARSAGYTAHNFPDLVRGTIQSVGCDYYTPISAPDGFTGFGLYWTPPNLNAKTNVRFVFITGPGDGNYAGINDNYNYGYVPNGYQALMINVPGMGHEPVWAPQMILALNWIENLGTPNYPAVALSKTLNVATNAAKSINLVATDEAGDILTYSVLTPPSHGTLTGTGSLLTYTPSANYSGPDSFTFKANDGNSDSNVATVTINVRANATPVASSFSFTTPENTRKAATLTATDADGDPLTYTIVTAPTNGTLSGTPPSVSYLPNTNYNGVDSFTYKVNDTYVDSAMATVNITVSSVNNPPVANNLTVLATRDTAMPLLLTAKDADSSYLTYRVVTQPVRGTLSGIAPNINYTPNSGYTGADSFTFQAYDGNSYSSNATVSITTTATPTLTLIDHTFNGGTGTLNGTKVTGGTLVANNATLGWITDTNSSWVTANGAIAVPQSLAGSAYIPLGTAIANGAAYELTMTLAKPTGNWVGVGFFDTAAPVVTSSQYGTSGGGTGWLLWRPSGNVQPSQGVGYDSTAGVGYNAVNGSSRSDGKVTNSTQTFTIKLDLSAANGTTQWGTMTVYAGNSSTGTVMGGLFNVPFTSAQHFNAVGFSSSATTTNPTTSTFTGFNLKRLSPSYVGTSVTVAIAASVPAAEEAGPINGEFTLTRSGYTAGSLDVTLALTGTAANGTDYETMPTTVNFPAGQSTITVPVIPTPDLLFEGTETVIAAIMPTPDYYVAASPGGNATVSIVDDTTVLPPTISIAAGDAAASETGPDNGQLTVTRVGGNTAIAFDATVAITGGAINGVDYQTLPTTVHFNANETTATLTVTPIDDVFVEGDETVVVTLAPNANYAVAASPNDTAAVVIADDDTSAIALLNHTFNEGTNTLNGTPVDAGTLRAGNSTLAWVADSGTVMTANGVISASTSAVNRSAYVSLGSSISNGNIYELTVTLTKPTGTWVGAGFFDSSTPDVTKPMDLAAAAGTAWFLWRGNNSTAEGNTGLQYDVNTGYDIFGAGPNFTHTGTSVTANAQTFTVRLDLSAANGTSNWGNMTVYQGSSTTDTVIGGLSNVAFTSAQGFRAVGFSAKSGNGAISNLQLAQIVPVISIAATTPNASEPATSGGSATSGTLTLTRSVLTTGTTTVSLSLSGTAANGMDYAPIANTVTFAPGETTKIVTITPLSDTLVEGSETIVATIGSGTGYTIGSPSSATVIIADVPPPYEAWISTYTFAPGADKTATGDPDGDSLANLIEYALGLNPTVASANPVTFSQVNVSGSTYLQLSVSRNPAVTNVTIEGLSTGTLTDAGAWSIGTTVNVTNTPSVFTVRDSQPIGSNNQRFLRLRFTLLP
jgi:hypothetical protein